MAVDLRIEEWPKKEIKALVGVAMQLVAQTDTSDSNLNLITLECKLHLI